MNELIDDIDFGSFRTFRRFQSKEDLLELTELLDLNGIRFQTEDYRLDFISAANEDRFTHEFILKLREDDFERANKIVYESADADLQKLPEDYYLLSYSNEELIDVLGNKDEWNPYDYSLARKILVKRGVDLSEEELETYNLQRLEVLSKPQETPKILILSGYLFALLGGFFGLITGVYLSRAKKVLPTGEIIHMYGEETRQQGKIIRVISLISLPIWVIIEIKYSAFFFLDFF